MMRYIVNVNPAILAAVLSTSLITAGLSGQVRADNSSFRPPDGWSHVDQNGNMIFTPNNARNGTCFYIVYAPIQLRSDQLDEVFDQMKESLIETLRRQNIRSLDELVSVSWPTKKIRREEDGVNWEFSIVNYRNSHSDLELSIMMIQKDTRGQTVAFLGGENSCGGKEEYLNGTARMASMNVIKLLKDQEVDQPPQDNSRDIALVKYQMSVANCTSAIVPCHIAQGDMDKNDLQYRMLKSCDEQLKECNSHCSLPN